MVAARRCDADVSEVGVWAAAALRVERCGQLRFPGGGSTPSAVATDGHNFNTFNYLLEDEFNEFSCLPTVRLCQVLCF